MYKEDVKLTLGTIAASRNLSAANKHFARDVSAAVTECYIYIRRGFVRKKIRR